MIAEKKILKQVERTEAAARAFMDEATSLKKMLGGVSTPPSTRKGQRKSAAAVVVANRNKKLFLK